MTLRADDIQLRRGRLLERVATQRQTLASDLQPVVASLATADRLLARVRAGADYVVLHPGVTALSVTALVAIRPRRAWRWAKRGFFAWQAWRTLSRRLVAFSRRPTR